MPHANPPPRAHPLPVGAAQEVVYAQPRPTLERGQNATLALDAGSGVAAEAGGASGEAWVRAMLGAVFAFVIVAWSSGFEESWKRRQARIALDWQETATTPAVNAKFQGKQVVEGFYTDDGLWVAMDPAAKTVNKSARAEISAFKAPRPRELWFSPRTSLVRQWKSFGVLLAMTALCILSIFLMQVVRAAMEGSNVASVMSAVVIAVFNSAWRKIALHLSAWENYRLEPEYREKLTTKLFVFQCINCYFSMIYIAFLKPYGITVLGVALEPCPRVARYADDETCAEELSALLYSILLMNILTGQAQEVGMPAAKYYLKKGLAEVKERLAQRKSGRRIEPEPTADGAPVDLADLAKRRKNKEKLSAAEEQAYQQNAAMVDLISEYERERNKSVKQGLGTTFYEYNELAIQYGYLVLFSAALPVCAMLALANNLIEVRSDAVKMVYASRRCPAEHARDIGAWARCLRVLAVLGIFCNLAFIAFTSDFFDQLATTYPAFAHSWAQIVFVVAVEHVLLLLKFLVDYLIADVPPRVRVRLARQEYIADASADLPLDATDLALYDASPPPRRKAKEAKAAPPAPPSPPTPRTPRELEKAAKSEAKAMVSNAKKEAKRQVSQAKLEAKLAVLQAKAPDAPAGAPPAGAD